MEYELFHHLCFLNEYEYHKIENHGSQNRERGQSIHERAVERGWLPNRPGAALLIIGRGQDPYVISGA